MQLKLKKILYFRRNAGELLVAKELGTEKVPNQLFCDVHPCLMFNWVIVKHWSQLEHAIGPEKIYANFLVNATTTACNVTEQALDCITRLINHDFDHKPWNKSQEFDMHITPKKNMSVSLKDEQNSLIICHLRVQLHFITLMMLHLF